MKKRERKIYASHAEYLDPLSCGSTIGYTITKRHRLCADVDLADCNRKITWYFDNSPQAIQKIDRAIAVLQKFKQEFSAARIAENKRRKQ